MAKDFNFEFDLKKYIDKCMYLSGIQGLQNFTIQIHPFVRGVEQLPDFENYHSLNNKQQDVNYNPRASLQTATLILTYQDFDKTHANNISERINIFIQEILARIIGFLQSRRIIIDILNIQNAKREVYAMPLFMAASKIDSVAFGPAIILDENLAIAIKLALEAYFNNSSDQQIYLIGMLKRFNDLLNLPYAYERAESLWKIIEALSGTPLIQKKDNVKLKAEYNRFLGALKIVRSQNLKDFLKSLIAFDVVYTDQEIIDARAFRNENTHEFLNFNTISAKQAGAYQFLIKALRHILEKILNLEGLCVQVGSTCIDGRVFV